MNGRPQYTSSETVFHNVSSEVYCGLLYLCNKRNNATSRSTHNCVPQGKSVSVCSEHTVLFLCLHDLDRKRIHRAAKHNRILGQEDEVIFLELYSLLNKLGKKYHKHGCVIL